MGVSSVVGESKPLVCQSMAHRGPRGSNAESASL